MPGLDTDTIYCRWAADKFGLSNVHRVNFNQHYVEGCSTCGFGEHFVDVDIWYTDDNGKDRSKSVEVAYVTDLINELVEYGRDS